MPKRFEAPPQRMVFGCARLAGRSMQLADPQCMGPVRPHRTQIHKSVQRLAWARVWVSQKNIDKIVAFRANLYASLVCSRVLAI